MLIKVVGSRKLNFANQDGSKVEGTQYAYLFEDPHCDGYWIDKFFVNKGATLQCEVLVGHDYDVNCYFRSARLDLSTLTLIK